MKIKFFCPRWGFENIPWEIFLGDVKREGYAGIEWFPYSKKEDYQKVLRLLQQYELEFCIVMTVVEHYNKFEDYLSALKHQLFDLCAIRNDNMAPLHISAQTGREYFTEQQIEECLHCCSAVSKQTGIPIYQETHRNKWAFAAHAVAPLLEKHPDLLLTLDVSHWFCVSESYLEDQLSTVQKAIEHARHIHARVGHVEGPQVWEPVAPEYAEALNAHLKIWDQWIESRARDGASYCTITPEFGPPPYMVFANRPGSPEQEQWRLNNWMKTLLERRYQNK
ncbi:MAG TPA: sugar phosphate isomerase/epimerase [Chitinophagaceae bacterium]|jgi:sugar phosphate isomerase/epimerase|nr:sugar phosphate isomerase/epimerase [Chitinophagaceae bacterium]